MSQPTPYTPTTDFSQQEANNASGRSTVNTAALDAEFANIELTLDQTLTNIQQIQRDDGKLKDLACELHTLSPEVLNLMMGFRIPGNGTWQPYTSYLVNDLASDANSNYVCITAHTSGAAFDSSKWARFGFTAGTDIAVSLAAAQASATAAANSATTASNAATSANNSATSATASASSASSSATSASGSASSAASSATSASNSAAAAEAAAAAITGVVAPPPVRQTVLSGPVDSNGFAAFGGSTGSTTVTASGTLKATAAAGGDANRTGSITNPSWTGLSTNGTMYLFLNIASDGTVTTGSTTLAPVYQFGGTYSTTNNQNTFNIQEMTMKVGNGSTASQVYRVFVGEVTVSGGVVSAITWYALMGRYESAWTNTLPVGVGTVTFNHNIGAVQDSADIWIECIANDGPFVIGDRVRNPAQTASSIYPIPTFGAGRNTMKWYSGSGSHVVPTSGSFTILTAASWKYKATAKRGW